MKLEALNSPLAKVLGTERVPTCDGDLPVHQIGLKLREFRTGCIVVTEGDEVKGIFTERDYITKLAGLEHELGTREISEFMIKNPKSVLASTSLIDALQLMRVGRFRTLVVVDAAGKLINVVSMRDIVDYITAAM